MNHVSAFAVKQAAIVVALIAVGALVPSFVHACGFYDLSITKSGPATVSPGERVTYTLEVAELVSGGNSAQAVVITDTVPAGLTFDPSATRFEYASLYNRTPYISQYPENWHPDIIAQFGRPGCNQEGSNVVCRLPMLDNNEGMDKARIFLTFTASSSLNCSSLSNSATISARTTPGQEGDNNPGNNTSNPVVTQCLVPTATPNPTPTPAPEDKPECSDSKDNDGDDLEDADDPGCHDDSDLTKDYNPEDNDERNGQCSDKEDNDDDGFIDRKDPDCHTDNNPKNDDSFDGDRDEDTNNRQVVKSAVIKVAPAAPAVAVTARTGTGLLPFGLTIAGALGLAAVRRLNR